MEYSLDQHTLRECLNDAGCNEAMVEQFLICMQTGCYQRGQNLLMCHRKQLLDALHQEQKRIDCLDFVIHQIKRKTSFCKEE